MNIVVIQRVLFALLLDAVTGPVWWYTRGLLHVGNWWKESAGRTWQTLGVGLWLKNLFVPMFAQYDWQGRIISFFIRLFQIIIRTIGYIFYILAISFIVLLWIITPIGVVYFFVITF